MAIPRLACGTLIVVALAMVQGAGARRTAARAHDLIAFVRFSAHSGHPRIYTVSPAGGKPRPLRLPVSAAAGPAWSRDGRRLAFVGGQNAPNANSVTVGDELYVAAVNGSRARRLTHDPAHEAGPSWAPDGKRIVFLRSRPGSTRSSLWIVGRNGRRARRLTYGTIDLEPSWAPGGRWIAFLRINPKTYHSGIWLVRPDGSGLRRILRGLKHASDPVWSPDGSHLLLTNGKALLVVARDGSGRRTLAKLSTDARGNRLDPQPAWSPDGRRIVFAQPRSGMLGRSDLWVVDADDGGLRRLTSSPGLDTDPAWRS